MAADPKSLKLWDRDKGRSVEEWLPDHQATYETRPRRSPLQWLQSTPLYDRFYALYQDAPWTAIRNERQVNILESENFGRLGFVEFGALTVGRIVQRHPIDQPFKRGAQKGGVQVRWVGGCDLW
ncbi:phosphatidylserine decarboxylase [Methylobacterium sp. CM6247]